VVEALVHINVGSV